MATTRASGAQPRVVSYIDACWMVSNVMSGAALSSDPMLQVVGILGPVLDRIGSIGGFLALFESGGPDKFKILRVIDVGRWEPRQRAARDAYVRSDRHAADPFLEAFILAGHIPGPSSAIRHELVGDETWYASEHVETFRKPAGMDSAIYVCMPAVPGASSFDASRATTPNHTPQPPDAPVHGWSVCANKPWRSAPFTNEQCGLLTATFHALDPLLANMWTPPRTGVQAALEAVPFRLRKVLACLLDGDSEKAASAKLGLRPHTVHTYVKKLYEHFRVRSRAELLVALMRQ